MLSMNKSDKILALMTVLLAVTAGISFWVAGVSDPGCLQPL
ncbi:MAG: hypothetical protein ACTSYF_13955 [Promethearchaeota archaeon]